MRSLLVFLAMATLLIGGCTPDRAPIKPEPGPGTGTISVGPFVASGSASVGPAGGTVDITDGPISGFQIEVAPDAFSESKTVSISSAPVTEHSLGADFNPISPMIRIDYGGGYAEEPMLVHVPVQVPAGHFAMGFYYDEVTGEVEGIPIAAITDNSIVLVARHFSGRHLGDGRKGGTLRADTFADILVASVQADKLYGVQDSGFRPGVDDWEFPNMGSYIAPLGHCAGQSLTALWYYSARKLAAEDPPLYNRFSTFSGLWQDNRDGYRFASVVQADYDNASRWNWAHKFDAIGMTRFQRDELHYLAFAYAIHISRKPQFIEVRSGTGGHALIVYRANNRVLSIADPNFPSGYNHFVTLAESGTFQPYESRSRADAPPRVYPNIYYVAKTALMSFDGMAARYDEMLRHTIGDYPPNTFPPVDLMWLDGTAWKELADTLASDADTLTLVARCQTCIVLYGDNRTEFKQLNADGSALNPPYVGGIMRVPLTPVDARLYFCILGSTNIHLAWDYLDFKTFVVRRPPIKTSPITNITKTTATGGGSIASDGGFPVTVRGVCWSTASDPTTADSHTTDGSGIGVFASALTGLSPETLYSVRAYATNSAGTMYGNQVTFVTPPDAFYIGQLYGGGIIFYIDGTGQHGLIGTDYDQGTRQYEWGCCDFINPILIGTSTGLGTGQANTTAIVNGCNDTATPARLCDGLVWEGYDDWFLPSKDELNEMYLHKDVFGNMSGHYWSSSEFNGVDAFVEGFEVGYQYHDRKSSPASVRAIRAF